MVPGPHRLDTGIYIIMAEFKSENTEINAAAETVFDRLSDLSNLRQAMAKVPRDKIPADQQAMYDAVKLDNDSITFPAGPVGEITLRMTEKVSPTLIRLEGVDTPVALSLSLHIEPQGEEKCRAQVVIDIAIPPLLKPMVAGPIGKLTTQFANLLPAVAGAK